MDTEFDLYHALVARKGQVVRLRVKEARGTTKILLKDVHEDYIEGDYYFRATATKRGELSEILIRLNTVTEVLVVPSDQVEFKRSEMKSI